MNYINRMFKTNDVIYTVVEEIESGYILRWKDNRTESTEQVTITKESLISYLRFYGYLPPKKWEISYNQLT